jgi:hypothetical protein
MGWDVKEGGDAVDRSGCRGDVIDNFTDLRF